MKKKSLLVPLAVTLLSAPAWGAPKPPNCANINAVINPGNQTLPGVAESTLVTLNGVNSNPKGNVTCVWTQKVTGAPSVTLNDPNSCNATFTAPKVGPEGQEFKFDLTVTSLETGCTAPATGMTDTKTTTVLVTDVNRPPVASAAADPSAVNEGAVVTLDGSSSSDPDNNALTYAWTQVSGTTVTITDSKNSVASFTAPPEQYPNGETLTFTLTVSDGSLSNSKNVDVTVNSVNQPPVANVACPATVDEGAPVALDGSGSVDPDKGLLAYQWNQSTGTPNADLLLVDLTARAISFKAPKLTSSLDTMTFGLTVTDNGGLFASATCDVKVLDITPPVIDAHVNVTAEATGPNGAAVTYADSTASDLVDGAVNVACLPISGSTFALGTATVSCSAADKAGNSAASTFTVKVQDTTPPAIDTHANVVAEATGPNGAAVTYAAPTASDLVDGAVNVACLPTSGSTFALGTITVNCSTEDNAGNKATGSFEIKVQDTTPPSINNTPKDMTAEATGSNGAAVTYAAPTASDLVDGAVNVACLPTSGSTFALGTTAVNCSAADNAGNKVTSAFTVTVQDTTKPVIAAHDPVTEEATSPAGAAVTYTAPAATDLVDGAVKVAACLPTSGSTFALGTTTVSCSATDFSNNTATSAFTVTVKDTTPPLVTPPANVTVYATGLLTTVVFGNATATDTVSAPSITNNAPASFPVGTTIITWIAKDAAGNTATAISTVTVLPWTLNGFYQPVDMNGIWNTVKNGSTVPLKFEVFAGSAEFSNTSVVKSVTSTKVACGTGAVEAAIEEVVATGGTTLRYDTTAGQFIFNWKTPAGAGTCHKVTMTTQEGSSMSALFKLK